MSEVKRIGAVWNDICESIQLRESSDGEFVKYEDYAALQQKLDAVLAENVIQKSGVTYFAFAPEYGFDYFTNKQDAINVAQAEIDQYREDAFDGWDEDVRRVSWGIVIQKADGFDAQGLHITDSQHTYQTCDYHLVDEVKTPATDAILNAVRAEGIYFAANRLLAAWDSGFIDDTPAQAYDISGAVLSAVEFLPDASHGDFKRDFADSIRAEIAAKPRAETDTTPSQYESLAGGK